MKQAKRQDDWAEKQAQLVTKEISVAAIESGNGFIDMSGIVAQALRQARLSALEEAVEVAEAIHANRDGIFNSAQSQGAGAVAIRIRALADGGGKA